MFGSEAANFFWGGGSQLVLKLAASAKLLLYNNDRETFPSRLKMCFKVYLKQLRLLMPLVVGCGDYLRCICLNEGIFFLII